MHRLADLRFSDIYIGEEKSWLSGLPDGGDPVPTPPETENDIHAIRQRCSEYRQESGRQEFNLRYDNVVYRVSTLFSLEEIVYILRPFPANVPALIDLGVHPSIISLVLQPRMTGMIVIAGAYGQGKTTTASSLVIERLKRYGGICVSIEDPPEMPLQGRHGEGVCYQTEVSQGGFADACRYAARWAPTIIFLGEIRDAETATEALKASINGRLVVCTIHADSPWSAIERLYSLASNSALSSEDVSSLLANGLSVVLHQHLANSPRRPMIKPISVKGDENKSVQSLIRNKKWEQLENIMTLQVNRMLNTMRSVN
ncbi:ATPase, T2SS/T4P/T4SS family [Marinobacterium sp. BA1]|uniref:ATPase, T2SS/T4P/T4SS family n=1 Tax=Marinobacterium sp. BA1 TaxID=3138931 RepID=UPI0034E8D6FB